MNLDLFDHPDFHPNWREDLCPGAVVLRGAALAEDVALLGSPGTARRSGMAW